MVTLEDLQDLLSETTVADSRRIAQATKRLNDDVFRQPDCLPALIALMQQCADQAVRQLAAVEARKQTSRYWNELAPELQHSIRTSLLASTLQESNRLVRHGSARLIASIASIDLPDGKWTDLTQFLVQASTSRNADDRVIGVYILYALFDTVDDFFASRTLDLLKLFSHTIADSESAQVRSTTLLAVGRMAELIDKEDKAAIKAFRALLPNMVSVLQECMQSDADEEITRQNFEVFQTLLILEAHLLSKHLEELIRFMVGLAESIELEDGKRTLALSWLLSCIRFRKNKVKTLRLGSMLVQTMLKIGSEKYPDDEDEDNPSQLAFRCIAALSISLPTSQTIQPLMSILPRMLSSSVPGERKSALSCLGASFEGALEVYAQHLPIVSEMIVHGLKDADAMVQRAALAALSSLADEFPEEISLEHATILPLVFRLMHSLSSSAKAAMIALDRILDGLEKEQVVSYLPQLVPSFFAMLASDTDLEAKTVAVAALGSAAHSAKDLFMPFLPQATELLGPALGNASPDQYDYRASVLECFGAIAAAVGAESFQPFEEAVARSAAQALDSQHSRLKEASFSFFAVLAKITGENFTKYVDVVAPALLKTLAHEDLFSAADLDEDDDDDENAFVDDGESKSDFMETLDINSAWALEKEIAAEVAGDIFAFTKQAFLPYLEETLAHLLNCLEHYYEGVRRSAVGSLYRIITTLYQLNSPLQWTPGIPAKVSLPNQVDQCVSIVRSHVMELLMTEDDKVVAIDTCRHLAETIRLCGPGILGTETDLKLLCDLMLQIFNKEHASQKSDDDFSPNDEGDEDELNAEDDTESEELETALLDAATEVLVSLAFALGDQFAQPFGLYLPFLTKMTDLRSSDAARASALAAFGEFAGGLKSGITPYTELLFQHILKGLGDRNNETRSNSAYAMGLLCEHSKLDLSDQYMLILQKLQPLFQGPNHKFAKDNAIGCTARMTISRPDAMPLDQILPMIISNLPLTADFAENAPVYGMFCQLYACQHPTVHRHTQSLIPIFESVLHGQEQQLTVETRADLTKLYLALAGKDVS